VADDEVELYGFPEKKNFDKKEALKRPVSLYDESERKSFDNKDVSAKSEASIWTYDILEKEDP
jgi:hypothetical protein